MLYKKCYFILHLKTSNQSSSVILYSIVFDNENCVRADSRKLKCGGGCRAVFDDAEITPIHKRGSKKSYLEYFESNSCGLVSFLQINT